MAKLAGVANYTVVFRWEKGVHLPRREEMVRLYELTGGEVTPNDFYDLPELPADRRAAA